MGKLDALFRRLDYKNCLSDNKDVVLIKLEFLVVQMIERLAFEEKEHSLLINIYQGNKAC